jgi:4'-phosphopantetheinyl transferase EntD
VNERVVAEAEPGEVAELLAALRAIAPPGVDVGAMPISAEHEATLHPGELELVASAVPRRRREFATGRALLRAMLGTAAPVLVLTSRAPALPVGVVASLAHDGDMAVVVIGAGSAISALGVDLEPIGAVGEAEARVVVRADEAGLDPTLAFVAKEAAYKAWSNSGGGLLDHHDVRITCAAGVLPAAFSAEIVAGGATVHGMLTRTSTRWLAVAAVDAPR